MAAIVLPEQSKGHSAIVRMRLHVNGKELKIGQLGPEFIILRDEIQLPPCDGEIMLAVDGRERRWRVALPEGVRPGIVRTPIAPL